MSGLPELLLSLWVAQSTGPRPPEALEISSDSGCPSGEAVRAALARLRAPDTRPEATVAIHATEEVLTVEIGAQGTVRRQLVVGSDCAARASAAALLIATWIDDLPAEVAAPPVLRSTLAEPVSTSTATPAPRPGRYEAGAGLAVIAARDWAPGVHAELVRLPGATGLAWQGSLDVAGPHQIVVEQRTTRWMRASAALGATKRHRSERFFLAGDLGVAGAFTTAWGTGYEQDRSDHSFTWGPVAGVRAGLPWGRFLFWTDVRGHWWVRGDSVRIDSSSAAWVETADLPSWDAQWSLGLSAALP